MKPLFSFTFKPLYPALPFIALLPIACLGFHFFSKMQELNFLEERITSITKKAHALKKKPTYRYDLFPNANRYYLSDHLSNLAFSQKWEQENATYHESLLKQTQSIDVDSVELKKILSVIEGVAIGSFSPPDNRPQLLIQNFELLKKDENLYSIDMQLIQRELK